MDNIARKSILALMLSLGAFAVPALAQDICSGASLTGDRDEDGFTDAQECGGLQIRGLPDLFPGSASGLARELRLDPDSKDVFVIMRRATNSLLGPVSNPFVPVTFNGITFSGLRALGVTAHKLEDSGLFPDRTVTDASPQKAVRITESLDANGTILGNCQWGTPLSLDGCVVYTQRALNFINSNCPGDPANPQVFLAYSTFIILHEAGHSLGGLAAEYNSRFGGYHYKAGAGVIMQQAVTYTTKGGKCTWFIPSGWNTTLDPGAVRLIIDSQ